MAEAQLPGKIFLSFPSTTVTLPVIDGEEVIYEVELSSMNKEDISAIENCAITYGSEDGSSYEQKDKDQITKQGMTTSYQCIQRDLKITGRKRKEGNDLKCDICGKQYAKLKQLTTHKKYHSDLRPYVCTVVGCGMAFKMANGLSRHMRTHTKVKPYKCSQCNMCFSQSGARKLHERRHNGERPYKCQICGDAFIQSSSLSYHMIKHSEDRKFQCDECGRRLKHKNAYERHKKLHKAKEFKCIYCFREYCEKYELQRHLKNCKFQENPLRKGAIIDLYDYENEQVQLPNADDTNEQVQLPNADDTNERVQLPNADDTNEQVQLPNADDTNEQVQLPKADDTNEQVQLPNADDTNDEVDKKVIKTVEKPHLCSICGKRFLSPQYLKQHMRCHEEKAALGNLCDYCGKMFRSKISLVAHIRTHTGESPYECSICKQSFSTVSILNNHFRNHFDDRPFTCKLCHSSFKKKEAVMRHMHIHVKDSPNNCEFCNKPSSDKRTKVVHYRVHFERFFQKARVDKPRGTTPDNYIQVLYHILKKNKVIKSIKMDNENSKNPFYVYNDTDFPEIEKIFKEIVDVLGMEKKLFNNPIAMKDLHKIGIIEKDAIIEKPIIQGKQKQVTRECKMKNDESAETKCMDTDMIDEIGTNMETNTSDNYTNKIENKTQENDNKQCIDTADQEENVNKQCIDTADQEEKNPNTLRRSTRKRKLNAKFCNSDSKKKVTLFSLLTKRKFPTDHGANDTKFTHGQIKSEPPVDVLMNDKNTPNEVVTENTCKDDVDYRDSISFHYNVQDKSATCIQEPAAKINEPLLCDMYIQETWLSNDPDDRKRQASNDLEGLKQQTTNDLEDQKQQTSNDLEDQKQQTSNDLEDPKQRKLHDHEHQLIKYTSDDIEGSLKHNSNGLEDDLRQKRNYLEKESVINTEDGSLVHREISSTCSTSKQTETIKLNLFDYDSKVECEQENLASSDHEEDNQSCLGGDNQSHQGGDNQSCLGGDNQSCLGGDNQSCLGGDNQSLQGGDNQSRQGGDGISDYGGMIYNQGRKTSVDVDSPLESDIQCGSGIIDREVSVNSEEILPDNIIGMKVVKINLSKVSNGHGIAKSFYCSECGKGFYLKSLLDRHESTCNGPEKIQKLQNTECLYPCAMCDKEFMSNGSRQRHMAVHNDILPYQCNICQKQFSQKITKRLHMERIHGNGKLSLRHSCQICKKRFKELEDMQRHQKTHKNRQRFKCEFCTNCSFYKREEYNAHVSRKHPIERPFRCGSCMKGFLTASEVKFHTKTTSCRAAEQKVLKLTVVDDNVNE